MNQVSSRRQVWWNWISVVALLAAMPWLLFPGGWGTAVLVILPLLWIGNRIVTGHFISCPPYRAATPEHG